MLAWMLGGVWTLPNSLIGLAGGLLALPWGARPSISARDGALVFLHYPWGPGGACVPAAGWAGPNPPARYIRFQGAGGAVPAALA